MTGQNYRNELARLLRDLMQLPAAAPYVQHLEPDELWCEALRMTDKILYPLKIN